MEYIRDYQLQKLNSFKTKAIAKKYCQPTNLEELQKTIREHAGERKLVIGGGCNMFFTQDFDGLIIHPNIKGIREAWNDDTFEQEDFVYVEVCASEDWDDFVGYCVRHQLAGVENLSLIPGTVGASPVQNIGAYGAEVKDVIHEVVALDIETGESVSFNRTECEFAYRNSIFKRTNKYVIVSVVFQLSKHYTYVPKYKDLTEELKHIDHPSLTDVRDAVIKIRQRKLPNEKELPNAGSFFKNPCISKEKAENLLQTYSDLPFYLQLDGTVKTSAAFLIDKSGFKNKRIGEVGTYPNQPLVIVNYGTENGADIVAFMKEIQAAVATTFDVSLEPEVLIY